MEAVIERLPLSFVLSRMSMDPFKAFGGLDEKYRELPRNNEFFDKFKPRKRYWDESRRDSYERRIEDYDAPRIRHFRDRLREGQRIDPINLKVDAKGWFHIGDGFHRMIAAILAEQDTIRVAMRPVLTHQRLEEMRAIDNIRREMRMKRSKA